MGLVLDSSTLIAAERNREPISKILLSLEANYVETQVVISSITVMELEHGWHRAQSSEIALQRRHYLDEIFAIIPVEPFTREMGMLAAKIDVGSQKGWPCDCNYRSIDRGDRAVL